jgi:chemotaxis protein histidine kinase CheA
MNIQSEPGAGTQITLIIPLLQSAVKNRWPEGM